jgi:hypothetical protein
VRLNLTAVTVSGCRLILVICSLGELADLGQVQAERVDLSQHAVQRRPVPVPPHLPHMPQVVRFGRARRGDHRHDQRGARCSQLNEGDASARTRNKGLASPVLIFTRGQSLLLAPAARQ